MGKPGVDEYDTLHALMEEYGLYRTINGVNPNGEEMTTNLPHGTYYGTNDSDVEWMRNHIRDEVQERVQKKINVFIAEVNTWAQGW
jgi:hypothetical protein